jgi:hypothetical protein
MPVHIPTWVFFQDWGMRKSQHPAEELPITARKKDKFITPGSDEEVFYSYDHFFYGMENGLSLELGGLDWCGSPTSTSSCSMWKAPTSRSWN